MESQFVWRGVVLEKTEDGYRAQITSSLEAGLRQYENDPKWWAHVGVAYGYQENPLEALEQALKAHLERVRSHLTKAREFEQFAQQILGISECPECGSLTLEDEQEHPSKCCLCADRH
jgi:hypothetical protein